MDRLTNYFISGSKHCQTGCIGLEVEHFILHKETGKPMEYDLIRSLLESIQDMYQQVHYEDGKIIGLESHWALITLEPGCQLEVSIACLQNLNEIMDIYKQVMEPISDFVSKLGYEIVYSGGLPTVDVDSVVRIDKKRYELMERWFLKSGNRGLEMMKATSAVHVSIDYADEKDFILKYRMANILHPIFMYMMHHTPYYAGKENQDVLIRDSIWSNTDPSRCGILPALFSKDFGFSSYSAWLSQVPLILMNDDGSFIDVKDQTMQEVAKTYGYSNKAIQHYLSMSFLDIRLKKFIEIRSADSNEIDMTIAYCALLKGLFYHPANVFKYANLVHSIDDIETCKKTIRKDRMAYGKNVNDLGLELITSSKLGLSKDEWKLLDCLERKIYEYRKEV